MSNFYYSRKNGPRKGEVEGFDDYQCIIVHNTKDKLLKQLEVILKSTKWLEGYSLVEDLSKDLYCLFFQTEAQFKIENEIGDCSQLNLFILKQIMNHPSFIKIKELTTIQPLNAIVAASLLIQKIDFIKQKNPYFKAVLMRCEYLKQIQQELTRVEQQISRLNFLKRRKMLKMTYPSNVTEQITSHFEEEFNHLVAYYHEHLKKIDLLTQKMNFQISFPLIEEEMEFIENCLRHKKTTLYE